MSEFNRSVHTGLVVRKKLSADSSQDWIASRSMTQQPVKSPSMSHTSQDKVFKQPNWQSILAFTTKEHIPWLLAAICSAIAAGAIPPTFSIVLGKIFDFFAAYGQSKFEPEQFKNSVTVYCAYLAGLGIASLVFNGLALAIWMVFGELQVSAGRDAIFDRLIEKPAEWFGSRKAEGLALLPQIQSQLRELQLATAQPLGYVIEYISTAVIALAIAFYYCWSLTLVVLAAVPISAVILSVNSRNMQYNIDLQQRLLTIASRNAASALNAMDVVKAFNGQALEAEKYSSAIGKAAIYYLRQARANALQIGLIRFLTMTMFVQGFWYGSYLVSAGSQSPAAVVTTFWCCLMAMTSIEQILPQILILEKAKSAGAALRALSVTKQGRRSGYKSHTKLRPSQCIGTIELKQVSFRYPNNPRREILNGLDMVFASGKMTFIIGSSGSGKSTIAQLLCNFYQPNSGQIFLDDLQLNDLDEIWLRQNVTLVEQEGAIFNDTLLQNIAYGRHKERSHNIDEIKQVADFALLQETISNLPGGLYTQAGYNGAALSGGERQRVALARSKLRDPPVLVLDESTSALDQTTRSLMLSAIRQWRENRTTIVISHDETQIRETDYVYFLRDGKIMAEGFGHISESDRMSRAAHNSISPIDPRDSKPTLIAKKSSIINLAESSGTTICDETSNDIYSCSDPWLNSKSSSLLEACATRRSDGTSISANPNTAVVNKDPWSYGCLSMIMDTRRRKSQPLSASGDSSPIEMATFDENESEEKPSTIKSSRSSYCIFGVAIPKWAYKFRYRRLPTSDTESSVSLSRRQVTQDTSTWPMSTILYTVWPGLDQRGKVKLLIGLTCALVHAFATPIFSWAFSQLLGTFINYSSASALKRSLTILAISIIDSPAVFLMHYFLQTCGQQWIDSTRKKAIERVLDQPRQFTMTDTDCPGALVRRLDRNAEEMRNLVGRFAAAVLIAVVMMSMAIVWSMTISWKLSLVTLSLILFHFLIAKRYQRVSHYMEDQVSNAANSVAAVLQDTFTNISTVRTLTLENHFRDKYKRIVRHALQIGANKAICSGLLYGLSESLIYFMTAFIFYYGAILVLSGAHGIFDILLVISLLIFSTLNLASIVTLIPQGQSSKGTARSLLRLATLPQDSHEHAGLKRPSRVGDIVFSNVSFSYPSRPNELVLRRVNLTFKQGTFTALVGLSGSGKSTIADLLLRMYSLEGSRLSVDSNITIAGHDLESIDVQRLRQLISIVPQRPTLFPGTVADNIVYGLANTSRHNNLASVSSAAKLAGLDDYIRSLPQSYDTTIGDGGIRLSGGQIQRLAIARALLRQPAVLILDEATSALDSANAQLVRDSITSLKHGNNGLTVIAITNSQEMMKVCDSIVVLENGQVAEEGRWGELLARNGPFAKLLQSDGSVGQVQNDASPQ